MGNEVQEILVKKIESLEKKIDVLVLEHIMPIREAISGLKVKSSFWGFCAGAIPVVLFIVIAMKWPALASMFLVRP